MSNALLFRKKTIARIEELQAFLARYGPLMMLVRTRTQILWLARKATTYGLLLQYKLYNDDHNDMRMLLWSQGQEMEAAILARKYGIPVRQMGIPHQTPRGSNHNRALPETAPTNTEAI